VPRNRFTHVTGDSILAAMRRYDATYPKNEYDDWRRKRTYKWAVRHGGHICPPKLILAWAAGFGTTDHSSGGADTNREFEARDFEVIRKPPGG
jgi:hypothetical protein